jgi:hypothetical protein
MSVEWELYDGFSESGPLSDADILRAIRADELVDTAQIRPVGKSAWKSLRAHAPFAMALDERGPRKPQAEASQASAKIETQRLMFGIGTIVQLVGAFGFVLPAIVGSALLLLAHNSLFGVELFEVLGWLGVVVGLAIGWGFLSWGRRLLMRYLCGACGVQLTGWEVRQCPGCKTALEAVTR